MIKVILKGILYTIIVLVMSVIMGVISGYIAGTYFPPRTFIIIQKIEKPENEKMFYNRFQRKEFLVKLEE